MCQVAHHGVAAKSDSLTCITYSIGFLAPTHQVKCLMMVFLGVQFVTATCNCCFQEMVLSYVQDAADTVGNERWTDPWLVPQVL